MSSPERYSHSGAVPAGQKKAARQKTENKLINNTLNEFLEIYHRHYRAG
jgi:hypothetical protein